jgi:penicillin-binding protein-related factor A (putative recombinase)
VPPGVYFQRIKDPAQSFSNGDAAKFSPKNPYDCYMYSYPCFFALELKSTKHSSVTFSGVEGAKRSGDMIKKHQIEALTKAGSHVGVVAGFVLNFRASENTYFLDISDFNTMAARIDKKSFSEKDAVAAGAIRIPQILKRTKYKFDIEWFVDCMKKSKNKEIFVDA